MNTYFTRQVYDPDVMPFNGNSLGNVSSSWNPFGQPDVPGMIRTPTKIEAATITRATGRVPIKIEAKAAPNGETVTVAKDENDQVLASKTEGATDLKPLAIMAALAYFLL